MKNFEGATVVLDVLRIKPNYSELARIYNMDRRTVKKRHQGIENKKRGRKGGSVLNEFDDIIKEKLSIPGVSKKGVYMFLKMNYNKEIGTYSNFNKYVNKNKDYFIQSDKKVHLRFETEYGKQLQFDWKGPITIHNVDGDEFNFYIFSSTLCASRLHLYIYSNFMTIESVERCLIETFKYLGGVPEECLTDNMSSIVNYSENKFTKDFETFAKNMGFKAKKCQIASPETKGKDESCNRFVNWIKPYDYEFKTEEQLIKIIEKINDEVNKQTNGTTNMPPIDLFNKEKEYLQPLPNKQIIDKYLDTMIPVKVPNTLLVYYKGAEYSVPAKFIGKTVKLNVLNNKLYIYYNKKIIAIHEISNKKINYLEEHYINALTDNLKNKSENEIEVLAKKNLELLGKFTK